MNILLTGHLGFIGKHFLEFFNKNQNYNVVTYDIKENKKFPSLSNINWVIHLGANSSTNSRDIDDFLTTNTEFTINLYEECAEKNINLQYASSASIYGRNNEFVESVMPDPLTPYAWSKYLIERYIKNNPQKIIVQGFRYFNVYGKYEDHKLGQASPHYTFEKQAIENNVINVFENSEEYKRDFISVEQVIDVHIKFIHHVKESGVWNLGSGTATSFLDIAKKISSKYNSTINFIKMPDNMKNNYQTYTCADLSKLNTTLKNIGK